MANNCWYCRKGGLVDLYFAGRTGVCPSCGSGVNVKFDVDKFVTIDEIVNALDRWAKSVCSESNEPLTMEQLKALPDGTTLYSYTDYGKKFEDIVTVNAREKRIMYPRSGYNRFNQSAVDGDQNVFNRRLYLKDPQSNDKPLTIEELMLMNGQSVWLSSMYAGEERFSDGHCGWYMVNVSEGHLINGHGGKYKIEHNEHDYGFRAYRTDQSHRANVDNEEELPF